jgi:hypothetical protein
MIGFYVSIRLSDRAAQALGVRLDQSGQPVAVAPVEEELSTEIQALLESKGLPKEGVRTNCWLDDSECEAMASGDVW